MSINKYYPTSKFLKWLGIADSEKDLYLKSEKDFLRTHIKPGSILLDVGIGTGRELEGILDSVGVVHGIDFDSLMLQEASRNLGQNTKVKLVRADAFEIPYPANIFDYVIAMCNTFGNFSDPNRALDEMLRVVKPDGEVIFGVYSQSALQTQLRTYRQAGIEVTKFDDDAVYTEEGFVSTRFSWEKLRQIAYQHDATVQIHDLTPISYMARLKRNDFISTAQ